MDNKDIEIKRLNEAHFDEFFDLLKKHFTLSRGTAPSLTPSARERMRKDIFSKSFNFEIHLANHGEQVIGFLIFQQEYSLFSAKSEIFLMHLFVDEPYRNQGIGQQLFDFCKKRAKELSCDSMEWLVLNWNKRAMEFYVRNGAKKELDCTFFELDTI